MDINKTLAELYTYSAEIKSKYPMVEHLRMEIKNIPYSDLKNWADKHKQSIKLPNVSEGVASICYHNIDKDIDLTIFLYSTQLVIKPAEIISL